MKKCLSAFMSIIIMLFCFPLGTYAAGNTYEIYTYDVSGSEATITGCSKSASGVITVPSQMGGNTVTGIGNSAFAECTEITDVILSDSILTVSGSAFSSCNSLLAITFKNPECVIYDSAETIPASAAIFGVKNSTAEIYAQKYSRNFFAICSDDDHSFEYSVLKEVTCTENGTAVLRCSKCGFVSQRFSIKAVGHYCTDWHTDVEPTCSTKGSESCTCSICGEKVTRALSKTEHTPGLWKWLEKPQLLKFGTKVKLCTHCGAVINARAALTLDNSPDMNRDNAENALDILFTKKELLNLEKSGFDLDFNGDNSFDIRDLVSLKKALVDRTESTSSDTSSNDSDSSFYLPEDNTSSDIPDSPSSEIEYSDVPSSEIAPTGGKYLNVGSGYVAEIVEYNAETFDGTVSTSSKAIDWSSPTNNYLPKGTVDYCSTDLESCFGNNYVKLRAGYRVYLQHKDRPYQEIKPVVNRYNYTLPDHNEITAAGFENNGTHTLMTFDCLWKAPFYFDILPQKYTDPSNQDYRISSVTFNYIDITFCYATKFYGKITIPSDNPLFSSARVIKNNSDITVRLYLKKQGAFYGWDSYYDESGNLCFEFLNPAKTLNVSNEYGLNLNGAKILIDVGHGGADPGASGPDSENHNEAIQNLFLANKIKAELESIGATVYMTRTENVTSSADTKINMLKKYKPDFCIAIHHNSFGTSTANGFNSYHFNAFSKNAAEYICNSNANTGIYKSSGVSWHYYFMGRATNCPVVLTENGFMSNDYDYQNIIDESVNEQKAKAITKGIVAYFKSIQ